MDWFEDLQRDNLDILDVGCGTGWLEPLISRYGTVTATDLADDVVARARIRNPEVAFVAGDFMKINLPARSFDVVVSLEVLSHVADQAAFLARCAVLLRTGGLLMLATQNRPALQRLNRVPPPMPGQLRPWVDHEELRSLLSVDFEVEELFSVTLKSNRLHPIRVLTSSKVERACRPWATKGLEAARRAARAWGVRLDSHG